MTTNSPERPPLLGQSRSFLDLMEQISRVAPLDRPVLLIGERGTGKELIAERLHYLSQRWGQPFVKVNCAALPETLLETELFGHEAGAFTGAVQRRIGRFELADGGSLFLDEIANASLQAQEKVLRVSEYGELERVGGSETLTVDVRIVAATNVDLPAEAAAGRFRHDLLDRLAFDVMTVPPLRARQEDVMLLAEHFSRGIALELGWGSFPGFSRTARDALVAYRWPGNVRELKNVVERAVYRAATPDRPIGDVVFDPFASPYRPDMSQLPHRRKQEADIRNEVKPAGPDASRPFDLRARIGELERQLIAEALEICRYNQRTTAEHLGLTYDQLRNLLKKHGLVKPVRPEVTESPDPRQG